MARKTNKTSHVLNLITNGEPEIIPEQPEQASAAPASSTPVPSTPAPASAPAAAEAKVTVVNADQENSAVEEEIQKKLLEEVEKEEQAAQKAEEPVPAEPAPAAEPEMQAVPESVPIVESEVQPEPEPASVAEPEVQLESKPEPEPVPVAESENNAEPVPVPTVEPEVQPESESASVEAPEVEPEPEKTYHMVNVMETILSRTGIMKYMKEQGGCTCSRCSADVYALVLTRLPAKYVVVDHSATNPIISYYESKYRMRILTETIKACVDVKENPRH